MPTCHPVETLSECLGHALHKALGEIVYDKKDWSASKTAGSDIIVQASRPHGLQDIEVFAMFPQLWSSTALGFGGIGGTAMTEAYTIAIRSHATGAVAVYFGGQFAYLIQRPSEVFMGDVERRSLRAVGQEKAYERR